MTVATEASGKDCTPDDVGIWVFVFGDLLLFSALFGVFIIERGKDSEAFNRGSQSLGLTTGATNTLLLLTGSLCVALGVDAIRRGAPRAGSALFRSAIVTGLLFGLSEGHEYIKIARSSRQQSTGDFYTYFAVYTGIHLLHLVVAIALLTAASRATRHGAEDGDKLRLVETAAVYWHFIDLIWVMLFTVLYLIR